MSDLKEVRDTIVSIANPVEVLRFADSEMDKLREQGSMYELSARHAWIKPILEFYTQDLEGWLKFVKSVRNKLAPAKRGDLLTDEYLAVQAFYKVLQVRWIQRRTRAITDVAVDLAVSKGLIEDNWVSKQRYMKRCVQFWKARKDAMLDAVRKASPTKRVSVDHREELLALFWDQTATEVNNGDIPPP